MPIKDITGQKFGRLTAIRIADKINGSVMWLCICECGNEIVTRGTGLRYGNSTSCGCYNRYIVSKTHTKHGAATDMYGKSKEYVTWGNMKKRCSSRSDCYKYYTGKGVVVCDRWMSSFESFLSDMGYAPSKDHSIERINGNGNYEPGNCKWATRHEQQRNIKSNIWIECDGKKMILSDWARELNTNYQRIKYHLKNKSISEAINYIKQH